MIRSRSARMSRSARPLMTLLSRTLLPVGTLALISAVSMSGCKDDKSSKAPSVVQIPQVKPVPAPAHHVADLLIRAPGATYGELRARLGGPLRMLPGTFASMVVTLLGVSPQIMTQIDEKAPCYGTMTDDGTSASGVLGIPLKSGPRTLQLLTAGADAKYKARKGDNAITYLDPRPNLTSRAAVLAIGGNYLLLGQNPGDLKMGAAYVAGTLTKWKSEPSTSKAAIVMRLPGKALAGPVAKRIEQKWETFRQARAKDDDKQRAKHGGRAPDFGEPKAALASVDKRLKEMLTVTRSLSAATVSLSLTGNAVHVAVAMSPKKGGDAAKKFSGLTTGSLAPMLAMPEKTVVAYLDYAGEKERVDAANDRTTAISDILGTRLKKSDANKVKDAMHAWAGARGTWLSFGIQWTVDQRSVLVRGDTTDTSAVDKAIRSLTGLLSVPAIKAPIATHLGTIHLGAPKTKDGITVVHGKRTPVAKKASKATKKAAPSSFEIAWAPAGDKAFTIAAAQDAPSWLEKAKSSQKMSDRPDIVKLAAGVQKDVSSAFFIDPRRLLATIAFGKTKLKVNNTTAPILFVYGKTSGNGWIRANLTNGSAREVFKMLTGSR